MEEVGDIYGGIEGKYDPNTSWLNPDNSIMMDDATLAKRLQEEEFNPAISNVLLAPSVGTNFARNEISKIESQHENEKRYLNESRDRERERERARERERELEREREHARDRASIRDKIYVRPVYSDLYDSNIYDRLYGWGVKLLPKYHWSSDTKKNELKSLIKEFISDELKKKTEENEIEKKIKELLNENAELKPKARASRRKSPRRAHKSAKKSSRRARKSAKKSSRRKSVKK